MKVAETLGLRGSSELTGFGDFRYLSPVLVVVVGFGCGHRWFFVVRCPASRIELVFVFAKLLLHFLHRLLDGNQQFRSIGFRRKVMFMFGIDFNIDVGFVVIGQIDNDFNVGYSLKNTKQFRCLCDDFFLTFVA